MPAPAGIALIDRAEEKDNEDKLYLQYCVLLPHFKQPISFSQYLAAVNPKIDTRPISEIAAEIEESERKIKAIEEANQTGARNF